MATAEKNELCAASQVVKDGHGFVENGCGLKFYTCAIMLSAS